MGIGWVLMLAAVTAGLSAFSVLLGQSGEGALAAAGFGSFMLGALGYLGSIFLQVGPSKLASRVRRETGATPGWLEPMWSALIWAEVSYIILASLAYVAWGVAVMNSGFQATWAGWASVVIGGLSVIGVAVAPSRMVFPQLPLLVPIVLGIALVIG